MVVRSAEWIIHEGGEGSKETEEGSKLGEVGEEGTRARWEGKRGDVRGDTTIEQHNSLSLLHLSLRRDPHFALLGPIPMAPASEWTLDMGEGDDADER